MVRSFEIVKDDCRGLISNLLLLPKRLPVYAERKWEMLVPV